MEKANIDTVVPAGPSVFLSYARRDQAVTIEFYHLLDLDGFKPWVDRVNLIAGQQWESEIDRAVREADCVVVFLSKNSVDHRGYVQKEISVALEIATREPEQGIFVLPVCLDESPVPDRLTHLHSVRSTEPPPLIGAKYVAIQGALVMRAEQLRYKYDIHPSAESMTFATGKSGLTSLYTFKTAREKNPVRHVKASSLSRMLWTGGDYLVRGCNPGGSSYAGVAHLEIHESNAELNVIIGMHHLSYKGTFDGETLALEGSHEVTYDVQPSDGVFRGIWEKTGHEELIPASPFAKRIS